MSDTLNDRLRRAAEMARQRQQPGIPEEESTGRNSHSEPQRPEPRREEPRQQRPEPQRPEPRREEPARQPLRDTSSWSQKPAEPRVTRAQENVAGASGFRSAREVASAPKSGDAYMARPNVPEVDEYEPERRTPSGGKGKNGGKKFVILGCLLAVAVIALLWMGVSHHQEVKKLEQQQEQLELANQQLQLANEYDNLNNEFAQYENQTSLLANDSIVQKYSAARAQVEKLLQELKNEKNKSASQISKLKGEIETLKGILRTYVAQINELKQENQQLTAENQEVKARNQQLTQTVETVQAKNRNLNERMSLAEKLNVTGVTLQALKKNGKNEKNVTKAAQLKVSFTVPQNNSTPVGQKVFYLRITNPEGELLGNAGTFPFEGSSLTCTAMKGIEYAGEEVHDVFYWNVTSTLTPGNYNVEMFTDGYRLCSRSFTLKK